MFDNFKYMLKNWIARDKKSLIYFFIRVPAMVLQPIITAYIPKAMIDCINEGVTVNRLILVVALLSILVALTTWLTPFMQELLNGSARIIRMRYAIMAFRKNLNTDYINIESFEGREKIKEQWHFTEAIIPLLLISLTPVINYWFVLSVLLLPLHLFIKSIFL